ncbi:MAG: hypothetical protein ACYC6A_18830 [Armatimonadota bacterium]
MNPQLRILLLGLLLTVPAVPLLAADSPAIRAIGEAMQNGNAWQSGAQPATLVIGEPNLRQCRVRLQLQLAPAAGIGRNTCDIVVMPADPADLAKDAIMRVRFNRDKEGLALSLVPLQLTPTKADATKLAWAPIPKVSHPFAFWPGEKDGPGLAVAQSSGLPPKSWHGRWLNLRLDVDAQTVSLWLEGRLVRQAARPAKAKGALALLLAPGDQVRAVTTEPMPVNDRFLSIDLDNYSNLQAAQPFAQRSLRSKGVPFTFTRDLRGMLDLSGVQWTEWRLDPVSYYENYDGGQDFLDDMRMPMLRVPAADYTAAHVLAVADADPGRTAVVTLRAGRYGWNQQTVQHDFAAVVPRAGDARPAVSTPAGNLYHVSIPMTDAFAQDIADYFDIEITKEIRLALCQDDAVRFRTRPLGLPSGVKIAAITFEKSPLQMTVTSAESGHAFVEPQRPAFSVRLTNITDQAQRYRLIAKAVRLNGKTLQVSASGSIQAGATATVPLTLPAKARGYYDLAVTLADARGGVLLRRQTSFALLPPDTQKHRSTSPFGTWDFYGAHYTSNDPDKLGPLYVKLGLRFGMFGATREVCDKWGVVCGSEPLALTDTKTYDKFLERFPGTNPPGLLFHEHSISLPHLVRVPDLFTDRPAYRMNEEEQKRFQQHWEAATAGAKAMREKYPNAHLRFGNGSLPFKEEFYRHHFPPELFDSAGNEAGSFTRLPETQPPDWVANNASLWMDRQILDAYGYGDKPITQCYEVGYVGTNPGCMTPRTQADYLVRHALHSLAWGIPEIKLGLITDVGNSYYFSGWGAAGFCRAQPEMNVKPSFVAFAAMTRVLDGAKFTREVPAGSPSLYLLEFARPDGNTAYALWTIRGQRPVSLTVDGKQWTLVDDQGAESSLAVKGGKLVVTASSTPVYLVGKGRVTAAAPGAPAYDDGPRGKVTKLSPLASMDEWQLETERNIELETFNFLTPRRPGNFAFKSMSNFEGKADVLKVTPLSLDHGKATMPMYTVLAHKQGLPMPGRPTEIGLWVNGNSSWGRVIFEFRDASGQRWISIGKESKRMAERYKVPNVSGWSTDDAYGVSRINFDGWRYLGIPLPGNYPGEGFGWPANSQWRSEKENIVHYPLTLTKLIVELPEKTLHLKDFTPAPRPEIYLKDLVVCEGPIWSGE